MFVYSFKCLVNSLLTCSLLRVRRWVVFGFFFSLLCGQLYGQIDEMDLVEDEYNYFSEDPLSTFILKELRTYVDVQMDERLNFYVSLEDIRSYWRECAADSIYGVVHLNFYDCGEQCWIADHYTRKWFYAKPSWLDFLIWYGILDED